MSRCKACAAEIMWVRTENGKRIPLDVDPVPGGNISLSDDGRTAIVHGQAILDTTPLYASHFSTCPDAGVFRRKR